MSQYLQIVLGFTPLETGIRILPQALTLTVFIAGSAGIAKRLGTRFTVALGTGIVGCALLYLSRIVAVDTPYGLILIGQVAFGAGLGLSMSPATNFIMQSVPRHKSGIASAINDTTRTLGGALGIAALGTIMNGIYIEQIASLKIALARVPEAVFKAIEGSIQGAHGVALRSEMPEQLRHLIITTSNHAFVSGMSSAMLAAAFVMFGAAVLSLLILPAKMESADAVRATTNIALSSSEQSVMSND